MVAHGRLDYSKRQDPIPTPTATGLVSATTASDIVIPTGSGLATDPNASTGIDSQSGPPLAPMLTPTSNTMTPTDSDASSSATDPGTSPSTDAVSSSSKPIALSTVIATCVGAFIGVSALIIFSLCVFRRYSRSLKKSARQRGPLNHRNKQASEHQRRSHLETWNKLEDNKGDDRWEGSYKTREANNAAPTEVTPMEKLTMFKKSPSVRTAYTQKSIDAAEFSFPSSYAEFDPNLAATLKVGPSGPQPLLKSTDSGQVSWTESKVNSVHSHVSNLSLAQSMAIPTPPPTVSHPHRWESAEVVHYAEGQSAEVVDPFEDEEVGSRKSFHNPFFSAQDYVPSHRQRSNSTSTTRSRSYSRTRSRANSTATQATQATITPARVNKGKERMRYSNPTVHAATLDPFDDLDTTTLPTPAFISHTATSSTSSMDKEDKERALKTLVAMLNLPEEEVRDRLRIASMQPSIISTSSSIYDSDVTTNFPLPPTMKDFMGSGSLKSPR